MIYGINFNGTELPAGYARKFAKTYKFPGAPRGHRARLVGIADTVQSKDTMIVQASNGHRRLFVHTKPTAGPTLYGIYSY